MFNSNQPGNFTTGGTFSQRQKGVFRPSSLDSVEYLFILSGKNNWTNDQ